MKKLHYTKFYYQKHDISCFCDYENGWWTIIIYLKSEVYYKRLCNMMNQKKFLKICSKIRKEIFMKEK